VPNYGLDLTDPQVLVALELGAISPLLILHYRSFHKSSQKRHCQGETERRDRLPHSALAVPKTLIRITSCTWNTRVLQQLKETHYTPHESPHTPETCRSPAPIHQLACHFHSPLWTRYHLINTIWGLYLLQITVSARLPAQQHLKVTYTSSIQK